MTLFYLPDLGEGLPDAEIRSWYIHVGDVIKTDEPMVAMETAKAVVDIPVPFSGKVLQLYGKPGDIIKTGTALINIEGENESLVQADKATVVGNLQTSNTLVIESAIGIESAYPSITNHSGIRATPAIRALAKKMHVDLNHCKGSGPAGQIVLSDLEQAAKIRLQKHVSPEVQPHHNLKGEDIPEGFQAVVRRTRASERSVCGIHEHASTEVQQHHSLKGEGYIPLSGVRRMMAITMSQSHYTVVPVTLVDDADIHAWPEKTDITLRLIRAIIAACQREPRLNAWFDGTTLSLCQQPHINLGIAMDAPEGLFVPVLKNVAQCNAVNLRKTIDRFKIEVKNRSIPSEDLSGATFVLSNVGIFAGRYANPIVLPPMVAILAVGRMMDAVVCYQGKPAVHKLLPLSLTVDHRAITGGEAARFLSSLIRDLQSP